MLEALYVIAVVEFQGVAGEIDFYFQIDTYSKQSSHIAYTVAAMGYCGDFYSQSGKIKDYILSFWSLFDNIHQGKHVL